MSKGNVPSIFSRLFGSSEQKIRVHLLIKGRIGTGWYDVDETLRLPQGATLEMLMKAAEQKGIPLGEVLAQSPHLKDTLMLNGERCAVADNLYRKLMDGDQVYLLSPFAGG